ncbi:MAG: transcriptional activator RfaH [Magnetospirillum sp. WYHS-4]
MKHWYAVHTHPQSEEKACRHLERQGFGAYLPRYRKQRRHARRTEIVPAPLFPRYIFVEADLDNQRWRAILSTVGVSYLVCHGDQPAAVPEGIVEAIRAREDDEGWVDLNEPPPFRQGDRVQIKSGPFSDMDALFQCRADKDRVTVLLTLLGRAVPVRVPLNALEAP